MEVYFLTLVDTVSDSSEIENYREQRDARDDTKIDCASDGCGAASNRGVYARLK